MEIDDLIAAAFQPLPPGAKPAKHSNEDKENKPEEVSTGSEEE